MRFAISEKEFKAIVNRLYRQLPETCQEPIQPIVDFLQEFMVNIDNEIKIGHYNYELRVGNRSVPLDNPDSDLKLIKMVAKIIVF